MGEDTSQDHNKVETLLNIKFFLKTMKLVLIIVNLSYYLGIFWLIICSQVYEFTTKYYWWFALNETEQEYHEVFEFKKEFC